MKKRKSGRVKDDSVISERNERFGAAIEHKLGQARFPCAQLTLPTFSGGPERVTRMVRGVWLEVREGNTRVREEKE